MSFNLLNVEPRYDHIDEDYSWTFYKLIVVRQHLLLNGSIKYSIRIGLGYPTDLLTTAGKKPTEEELERLTKLVCAKVWNHLHTESQTAVENFESFNKYVLTLGI